MIMLLCFFHLLVELLWMRKKIFIYCVSTDMQNWYVLFVLHTYMPPKRMDAWHVHFMGGT